MSLLKYTRQRLFSTIPISSIQRAPYSSPVQRLRIPTTDGVELDAVLWVRNQPNLLIICHGFAASQYITGVVWLAETLCGPWDILTFNWRGYGASGGHATLGGDEAHDLIAMLTYGRSASYRAIGVIGDSMGGLITIATLGLLASDPQTAPPHSRIYPDRIATLGAPADYELTGAPRPQMFRHLMPRRWTYPLARPLMGFRMGEPSIPDPLAVVNHIPVPLLMLHGDADRIVSIENAYMYKERVPQVDLRIYEGVGHGSDKMHRQAPGRLLSDLHAFFLAMDRK